jgi:nucleotide-binding universal stress UspA family protein
MFKRILIACDTGESSRQAIDAGIKLAAECRAEVALVHITAPPVGYLSEAAINMQAVFDRDERLAREMLRQIHARVPVDIGVVDFLAPGDPGDQIVKIAARWGAEVIVMGTHGAGRLGSFLVGSTVQSVLQHAPCPVLVVRPTSVNLRETAVETPEVVAVPFL